MEADRNLFLLEHFYAREIHKMLCLPSHWPMNNTFECPLLNPLYPIRQQRILTEIEENE